MARDDSYLLKFSLVLAVFGAAVALRSAMPSESFKLLFVGLAAALLLPRALQLGAALPAAIRLAAWLWFCSMVLSGLVALDTSQALLGSYERAQGLSALLLCMILAFAQVPHGVLTPIVALSCGVISLWALAQTLGIEPWLSGGQIEWQHTQGFGARAFASVGNPVNLGNWLSIALAYLLSRLRDAQKPAPWHYIACGLAVLALTVSGARAAILASLLAALVIYGPRLSARWRIGLGAMMLVAAALLIWMPGRNASVNARLELWRSVSTVQAPAIDAFGRADPQPGLRFWLGYGQDLQSVPLQTLAQTPGQFADRAHSLFIDLWLSTGALGVITTLILIATIWRTRANSEFLPIAIAAGVSWSFSFGLSADKSLFALALGAHWRTVPSQAIAPRWLTGSISGIALILVWLSYRPIPYSTPASDYASWRRPEQAIAHFRQGQALFDAQPQAALLAFRCASALSPWRADLARASQSVQSGYAHPTGAVHPKSSGIRQCP